MKFTADPLYYCSDLEERYSPDELRKKWGIIYTPEFLAEYIAQKTVSYFLKDFRARPSLTDLTQLRIIDPAFGEGQLLCSIWNQLVASLNKKNRNLLNPKEILCGIDIDNDALTKTMVKINSFAKSRDSHNLKLIKTNALFPLNGTSREEGWAKIKDKFTAPNGFDILIANPPWGAETIHFKENLLRKDYRLYQGQFDTAELFVELALSVVKPGGYFAFILPDSIFSFERKRLREMLLTHTTIKFLARLGEKIFDNVNRACALLICKKQTSSPSNKIRCLRLNNYLRNDILIGEKTLSEAENSNAHEVYQRRFYKNKNFLFDIDVIEEDEKTLKKIKSHFALMGDYLISSRGVELSKKGKVCKCENCGLWMPFPISSSPECNHCHLPLNPETILTAFITSKDKLRNSAQLIVGENITRYRLDAARWILTDKKGINYKTRENYVGPKIVVRKTGVGISATIDYSGAYTNQVVYIFRQKDSSSSLVTLEFLLAAINSRVIYYFMLKNFGETEWRSHPYITQKQILDLPLPRINPQDVKQKTLIKKVTKCLKPYLKKNKPLPSSVDAKVECAIAKFYGLSKRDYINIYKSLNKAESLIPVKALKHIQLTDIFSMNNLPF